MFSINFSNLEAQLKAQQLEDNDGFDFVFVFDKTMTDVFFDAPAIILGGLGITPVQIFPALLCPHSVPTLCSLAGRREVWDRRECDTMPVIPCQPPNTNINSK